MDVQVSLYQPGGASALVPSAAAGVLDLVKKNQKVITPLQIQMEQTIADRAKEIDQLRAKMMSLTTQLQQDAARNAAELNVLQHAFERQETEIGNLQHNTETFTEPKIKNLRSWDIPNCQKTLNWHNFVICNYTNAIIKKWIPQVPDVISKLQSQGYPVPPQLR